MRSAEIRKNAAPWFVLLVVSLALATSPTLMRSCFQADPLSELPLHGR